MAEHPIQLLLIARDPTAGRRVGEMLARAGTRAFEVECAVGPETAGGRVGEDGRDVVLLDLAGLDRRGAEVVAALRARWPVVPVVVLGDSAAERSALLEADGGVQDHLLEGKFDADLLARTLRHAAVRGRAERATAEKQNLLRNIVDNLPDHVYAKDLESRFILANHAIAQFFGFDGPEGLVGKSDFDLFPHDAAASFRREELELMRSGRPSVNRETVATDVAGGRRWMLTHKAPLRDDAGRVIGLVGVNRDVTERTRAVEQLREANASLARREAELLAALEDVKRSHEELRQTQLQLLQAEKLESIGRVSAGVAHEIKNPLAVVGLGIEYLSNCPTCVGEQVPAVLRSMRDAIRRADHVVRGLLDFSAPSTVEAAPHDLGGLVGKSLSLVAHETRRRGIKVSTELAANVPPSGQTRTSWNRCS